MSLQVPEDSGAEKLTLPLQIKEPWADKCPITLSDLSRHAPEKKDRHPEPPTKRSERHSE